MAIFNLTCVPAGTIYKRILEIGLQHCKFILFVIRKDEEISVSAKKIMAKMAEYLIERKESSEWPGTQLFDETAIIYRFTYNHIVFEILTDGADNFFDWVQPNLPEDLCLLRNEQQEWFATIAHEDDCYFEISENEAREIEKEIPQIGKLKLQN